MDGRLAWTDCDEAGDYVVPNVLSLREFTDQHRRNCTTHTQTLGKKSILRGMAAFWSVNV